MPRPRKPWFRKATGWWMAEIAANPPVDGGDPTVASIVDAFLDHALRRDSPCSFYERKLYLQQFVDDHGFRMVKDCLPFHLTSGGGAESSNERAQPSGMTRLTSHSAKSARRPL